MAWTAPTVRTTGELITASLWNADIVANLIELRAGGLALSSQAAGDIPYASSASQLTRGSLQFLGATLIVTGVTASQVWIKPNANTAIATVECGDGSSYGWNVGKDDSAGNVTGIAEAFYWYSRKATATVRMTLSPIGVVTVNGFGAHTFSGGGTGGNYIRLRNTTAGTGNDARIYIDADGSIGDGLSLNHTSSTYTAAGIFAQAGSAVFGQSSGGLSVAATHASGEIRFYTGGTTLRGTMAAAGTLSWSDSITSTKAGGGSVVAANASNSDATTLGSTGISCTAALGISTSASGGTITLTTGNNGDVIFTTTGTGLVKFTDDTTGGGSAALGANSPAVTNTAPYTWLKLKSSDGSTVYVPAFK